MDEKNIALGGDTYRNRYWKGSGHNKGKYKKLKKKCAKCGKTSGMLDIHHKSGHRKDLKTGKGLQVLCRSCHRKLHQGKGNSSGELDLTGYKRYEIAIASSDIFILEENEVDRKAIASAGMEKQKDLMYVRFVLVHEGANKNRDFFTRDDLKAAANTPVHKAVNWEHKEPCIGTIYKSAYVEVEDSSFASATKDGKRGCIVCDAVIWKQRFPALAKEMIDRHEKDCLRFSMETYFGSCSCTECNEVFASRDYDEGQYCEHLNYRKAVSSAGGNSAYRRLHDNVFTGTGVVRNPADVDAESLALAEEQREEARKLDEIKMTKAEFEAKLAEAVKAAIEDYKLKNEADKALSAAQADNEALKAKLVEADNTIAKLKEEGEKSQAALKELEAKISVAKAVSERMKVLAEAGLTIPSDQEELKTLHEAVAEYTDKGFNMFVETVKKAAAASKSEDKGAKGSFRAPAFGSISESNGSGDITEFTNLIGAFLSSKSN